MAGFVAAGLLRGDHPQIDAPALAALGESERTLVDVRTPKEFAAGHIPGATNIPVDELRERLGEIPRDREVIAYCQVSMRGYLATRVLKQAGYHVRNLSGGFKSYRMFNP